MDRCEHMQKMTRFCATDCCVWRECAGCERCMAKYHNHVGPSVILDEKEVETIFRKFKTDAEKIKPKVGNLDQYLHDYFNVLKLNFVNFVDELDRKVRTELCYPYLNAHNLVGIYKKLKKKEYKKIMQRDFKVFYEATLKVSAEQVALEEKTLYEEAVKRHRLTMNEVFSIVADMESKLRGFGLPVTFKGDTSLETKLKALFTQLQLIEPEKPQPPAPTSTVINPAKGIQLTNASTKGLTLPTSSSSSSPKFVPTPLVIPAPQAPVPEATRRNSNEDKKQLTYIQPARVLFRDEPLPVAETSTSNATASTSSNTNNNITNSTIPTRLSQDKNFLQAEATPPSEGSKTPRNFTAISAEVDAKRKPSVLSTQNYSEYDKKQSELNEMKKNLLNLMSNGNNREQQNIATTNATTPKQYTVIAPTPTINTSSPLTPPALTVTTPSPRGAEPYYKIIEPTPTNQITKNTTAINPISKIRKDSLEGVKANTNLLTPWGANELLPNNPSSRSNVDNDDMLTPSLNLGEYQLRLPLTKQVSEVAEVKNTKLPGSETTAMLNLTPSPPKSPEFRAVVLPVVGDFSIDTGSTSPMVRIRRGQSEKSPGDRMTPIKEQSSVQLASPQLRKRKPTEIEIQARQTDGFKLSANEQKSISLLTESLSLDAEAAIPLLKSALELSANNLSAAEYLSFLLLESGQAVECLRVCNKFLQQLEGDVQKHLNYIHIQNNRAVALIMLGRYSQSIPILEKCLEVKESDRFYKNLGDAYYSIGIYEKSVYNYEKSIALNNASPEAHYNLAVCLYSQQSYYNAKHAIEEALKLDPEAPDYIELEEHIRQKI